MGKKTPSFEDTLHTLEQIVEELESGELSLDEALERYERGMAAHKQCLDILAAAEARIEVLLKEGNQFTTQPFRQEEGETDEEEGGDAP